MPPFTTWNLVRFGIPLLIVWFLVSEGIYFWQIAPGSRSSVSEFASRISTESSVRVFESESGELWEYQGKPPHLLLFAFPSAPPLYFFTAEGDYIGWIMDPAEMTVPEEWRPSGSMEVLKHEDAMRRFLWREEGE